MPSIKSGINKYCEKVISRHYYLLVLLRYNGSETNYQGDESNDAASNCSFDGIEMAAPFRQRQYSNIVEEEVKEDGKVESKEVEKNAEQDGSVTDQSDNSSSVTR